MQKFGSDLHPRTHSMPDGHCADNNARNYTGKNSFFEGLEVQPQHGDSLPSRLESNTTQFVAHKFK